MGLAVDVLAPASSTANPTAPSAMIASLCSASSRSRKTATAKVAGGAPSTRTGTARTSTRPRHSARSERSSTSARGVCGDFPACHVRLTQAIALFRELDHRHGLASSLMNDASASCDFTGNGLFKSVAPLPEGLKQADAALALAREFVLLDAPGFAVTRGRFRHAPPLRTIGAVDERHGLEQPLPVVRR